MNIRLLNVVVPVYNGEAILAQSIEKLAHYLQISCRCPHEIIIAENGSTDRTLEIAQTLARKYDAVKVLHLDQRGRGGVLKRAWNWSRGDILTYMDVDLSADLEALPLLLEALTGGRYDLAVGSRLLKGSSTVRCFKREVISRGYNILLKWAFRTRFSDAQCGFKALTGKAAAELLPLVDDNGWFMDTELLVIAEKLGYRVYDLPIRWVEGADSRVRIWPTVIADLRGIMRLRRNFRRNEYQRRVTS